MNHILVGLLALAIVVGYAPILRGQIRGGQMSMPLTGPAFPVQVRRSEHPWLFWAAVGGQIALLALIALAALAQFLATRAPA